MYVESERTHPLDLSVLDDFQAALALYEVPDVAKLELHDAQDVQWLSATWSTSSGGSDDDSCGC